MKIFKIGPRFCFMERPKVPKHGPQKEPQFCFMERPKVPKDGPRITAVLFYEKTEGP